MKPWPDCPACRGKGFVMATTRAFSPPQRFECTCPKRPGRSWGGPQSEDRKRERAAGLGQRKDEK